MGFLRGQEKGCLWLFEGDIKKECWEIRQKCIFKIFAWKSNHFS